MSTLAERIRRDLELSGAVPKRADEVEVLAEKLYEAWRDAQDRVAPNGDPETVDHRFRARPSWRAVLGAQRLVWQAVARQALALCAEEIP